MKGTLRNAALPALAVLLALAACASAAEENPLTPAAVHTFTPLTTAHATPTQTAIVGPSDTPEPTATELPTETATAGETGSPIVLPSWVPDGAIARIGLGIINQVEIAPDGKTFAVAGEAGLFLFRTESQELVWRIPTAKSIESLVYSAEGNTIAAEVKCIREIMAPSAGTAYSPCIDHSEILVIDSADGGLVARIDLGTGDEGTRLAGMALSVDGREVIAAIRSEEGIVVYDSSTGKPLRTFPGAAKSGFDPIAFSPDGRLAAIENSSMNGIQIVDLSNGKTLQSLTADFFPSSMLVFSKDGGRIARARETTIDIWDVADGDEITSIHGPRERFGSLAFSPDGDWIVTGDFVGYVNIWDASSGKSIREYPSRGSLIKSVGFVTDREMTLAATNSAIELSYSRTGVRISVMKDDFSAWSAARYSREGQELILRGDNSLRVLLTKDFSINREYPYPDTAQLSPDFMMFAEVDTNFMIHILETASGRVLYALKGPEYLAAPSHGPQINLRNFAFSNDNRSVFTFDQDSGVIDAWDIQSGVRLQKYPSAFPNNRVYTSTDGERVAILGTIYDHPGSLTIYSAKDGKEINSFPAYYDMPLGFSDDLSRVITRCELEGSWEKLCLYDVPSGAILSSYSTDLGVNRMGNGWIAPDGLRIAIGTRMGPLIILDAESGQYLHTFTGHTGLVIYLAFSLDGTALASTSADGTVVVWSLE
jgi:WD40 repeat protein